MGYVIGVIYCLLWYSSIIAGYAGLFCPLLPLLLVSNKWYRQCTDVLFTFWQIYPTALLEVLCNCDIQVSGDAIQAGETSILVMNHRTRTDWNFLWPAVYHCTVGPGTYKYPVKFVLKDVIRHIPGPGWVMQLACFLYIKRCWVTDRQKLQQMVDYFCDISYKFSLLLFPEGTDFTSTTRNISHKYAERNKLQKYENVLHPRTTGFSFLAYKLLSRNSLDAVYDITLVYCDTIPQTEAAILRGKFPKQVRMHLTRYPLSVLPRSEDDLKLFLEERWSEKEKVLEEFRSTGKFLHGQILKKSRPKEIYTSLIFWSLLPVLVAYAILTQMYFRYLVVVHTLFLIVVNFFTGGFQDFEVVVYNLKKSLLRKVADFSL